jgi:hypothetical protein
MSHKLFEVYRTKLNEAPIAPQDAGFAGKLKPELEKLNANIEAISDLLYGDLYASDDTGLGHDNEDVKDAFHFLQDGYNKFYDKLKNTGFKSIMPGIKAAGMSQYHHSDKDSYGIPVYGIGSHGGMVPKPIKLK